MPILDDEYRKLKTIETTINSSSLLIKGSLKVFDNKAGKVVKKMKVKDSKYGLMNKILSFLGKIPILNKLCDLIKNSKLINFFINLADKYLSVCEKIEKLSFFKFLSGCGAASCVISLIWWFLEKINVVPKKKTGWFKFLDGAISIFGYLTGLAMDILDLILNPLLSRKIAAGIEIALSSTSLIIHLYTLIKY